MLSLLAPVAVQESVAPEGPVVAGVRTGLAVVKLAMAGAAITVTVTAAVTVVPAALVAVRV